MVEQKPAFSQKTLDSVRSMRIAATRIAFPPFRDEATQIARQQAIGHVAETLKASGLEDKDYVGFPMGSQMQIIEKDPAKKPSDRDFFIALNLDDWESPKVSAYYTAVKRLKQETPAFSLSYETHDVYPQSLLLDSFGIRAVYFFIYPDELAVGDPDLLHSFRLRLVEELTNRPRDERNLEWRELNRFFDDHFRNWRTFPDLGGFRERQFARAAAFAGGDVTLPPRDTSYDPNRRLKRFEENLSERASYMHNPQNWMQSYMASHEGFELPSFETYRDSLIHTEGAILLHPDYITHGIKEAHEFHQKHPF